MGLDKFLREEVQDYISQHQHYDITKILFTKSPFADITIQELAQQLKGKKTAEKKFPFLDVAGIVFPPNLNLEQASSQATADYKSKLFAGEHLLDLTSGFGIDAFWLGKGFSEITLVERNTELLNIVKHNWHILSSKKTHYINGSLEDFLKTNNQQYSMVYLDPARRDEHNRKKFLLEDLSPNLLEVKDEILQFTSRLVVKLSPLMDISMLITQLPEIKEIYIIAVKNEVKELLLVIEKAYKGEVDLTCVNLESTDSEFNFCYSELKQNVYGYSSSDKYLYLPNHAVLKSGAFNLLSQRFSLHKLDVNTHFYTSANLYQDFPGRVLEVQMVDAKAISKNEKYNIISKNYPLTPEQIKKKYKIKDGGKQYLIFTQAQGKKVILKSN
ncbi:RsmD family RNA methyltransferase [Elizabethkingia sp. JS20170427COW]|uniref:THUMP-like domain-containing protein n=1 Tax=Elizabethkingia sp. JS20170427COW TaxID=2583851 RepID=UPI001110059B|nr:RsmD family RNA methyltransferase [Elizabethkingia sp. JS20170427COW]QCX52356.1 methyltransferase [Elizabethkingia sp. JS20170427COW]